eukprot:1663750-Rhodomonas_salina.2
MSFQCPVLNVPFPMSQFSMPQLAMSHSECPVSRAVQQYVRTCPAPRSYKLPTHVPTRRSTVLRVARHTVYCTVPTRRNAVIR